jgi:hypothetical protein
MLKAKAEADNAAAFRVRAESSQTCSAQADRVLIECAAK